MRLAIVSFAAAFGCVTTTPAFALDDWDGDFDAPPAEIRSDVMIGLSSSLGVGRASGYPNEASQIGVPEFEADTGFGFSNGGSLFVGGALHDAFSVALGISGGSLVGGDLEGSGGGFVLRLEGYPLFWQGGAWRNLGLFANFGAGGFLIVEDEETRADGGAMSVVGGGAFYEAFRWGPLAMGPSLEYLYLYSQSLTASSVGVGWRTVIYTGP